MASKYWIKLYHEILYDRKLASLDDHLWRCILECFLMAGEQNEEGYLPSLDNMAWTLRADIEQLETDLNELIRIGILEFKDERYFVRKFSDRQEPLPKAEYMRRKRERAQKDEHYDSLPPRYQPVTISHIESESDIESDVDTDTEEEANPDGIYAELSVAFCNKTQLPELTGGPQKWHESLTRMGDAGVKPIDIENAVDILRDKDYSIVRLSSVENTAIGEMSKRVGKKPDPDSEEARQRYVSGEFSEFIEH